MIRLIGVILLITVSFASDCQKQDACQELDFHGNPFASPPYSWEELDVTWNKVQKIRQNIFVFILSNLCVLGERRYLVR